MQQDTGSILHSIITAKLHNVMQPANGSVKAVLGTVWQWYPNPTRNCCFGRYASAEEMLRPKRPIWSQLRGEIKSSEPRTLHSLHVSGLVCSKYKWVFSIFLFLDLSMIYIIFANYLLRVMYFSAVYIQQECRFLLKRVD